MSDLTSKPTINLQLTDIAYGGDAVGRDPESGIAVFAWPGIVGEQVSVVPVSTGKNLVRGLVTEVHSPSPEREVALCAYFGSCGGCQWQHMTYRAQVRAKQTVLRSQLSRLGGLTELDGILREPVEADRPWGYRNTAHFALDPASLSLAYYRRNSRTPIPIEACPISNQGINVAIPVVNALLAESGTAAGQATAVDMKGIMRVWRVTIRHSEQTGHSVLVFHTRSSAASPSAPRRPDRSRRGYSEAREERDVASPVTDESQAGAVVLLQRKAVRRWLGSNAAVIELGLLVIEVMDDGTVNRLGETRLARSAAADAIAEIMSGSSLRGNNAHSSEENIPPLGAWLERVGGVTYWVGPSSFFQTNTAGAESLVREVGEWLGNAHDLIVDAHAGVGLFAVAHASRARRVLAFETEGNAVESGRFTARAAGRGNVEFSRGRAEELTSRLAADAKINAVVLDPPRSGCHPALLTEVARRRIPRIVYVSCDPSTLARDVKVLAAQYEVESIRLVDLFPQTFHIESVTALRFRE